MTAPSEKIRIQRDQFLGFSFACADAFLEVHPQTHIIESAFGNTKAFFGINEKQLIGQNLQSFFGSHALLTYEKSIKSLKSGTRSGAFTLAIHKKDQKKEDLKTPLSILNLISLPAATEGTDYPLRFYISLKIGTLKEITDIQYIEKANASKSVLSKDNFLMNALDLMDVSRGLNQDLNIHFIEFSALKNEEKDSQLVRLKQTLTQCLLQNSADGYCLFEFEPSRFAIISEKSVSNDVLKTSIWGYISIFCTNENIDIKTFNKDSLKIHTLTTLLSRMDDHENLKCMIYALSLYNFNKTLGATQSLKEIPSYYLSINNEKQKTLQAATKSLDFDLNFHPIIEFTNTPSILYYEVLFRLQNAGFTREWLALAEDIDFSKELDIAIFERTLNHMQYKNQSSKAKFGINLTLNSFLDQSFRNFILKRLTKSPDMAQRLVIEINSLSGWKKMIDHAAFFNQIRDLGVQICLDDFLLDQGYAEILQKIKINYIKINEKETQHIAYSESDRIEIAQLISVCHDLNIQVIAEKIEESSQLKQLKFLKISLAQGFIFALPSANLINITEINKFSL
jgi:EAL domain-containing protein (putative c-di-GMP-specific phosphodiesterase class I)